MAGHLVARHVLMQSNSPALVMLEVAPCGSSAHICNRHASALLTLRMEFGLSESLPISGGGNDAGDLTVEG
jgi:hypothetical protein